MVYKDDYKAETIVELKQNLYFRPTVVNVGYLGKSVSWNLNFRKLIFDNGERSPIYLTLSSNLSAHAEVDSLIFIESNGVINEYIFDNVKNTFFIKENHSTSVNTNTSTVTEKTPITTVGFDNKVINDEKETTTTSTDTQTTYSTNRYTLQHVKAQIELGQELIDDIIASKQMSIQLYINGYPHKATYSLLAHRLKLVDFLKHEGVSQRTLTYEEQRSKRQARDKEFREQRSLDYERRKADRLEKNKKIKEANKVAREQRKAAREAKKKK